jgi:Holliday junction resolvasome RuvABC endonuclease subunit
MEASYLGIDPGLSGGLAVVSGDSIRYKMAMPTISFTTKKGKIKKEIDRDGVMSFLKTLPEHTHVAIEKQQAFRSQDIMRTCTTCQNYGILLMALSIANLYITEVPSDTWQSHFNIVSVKKGGGKSTKEQALEIASAIYHSVDFRKSGTAQKAHDGIVDAVLIANYCQAQFTPFQNSIEEIPL